MATLVKRTFRATPHRTASQAWQLMCELLAPDARSDARKELTKVSGVLGQLIASESFQDDPVVVHGDGPRVRLYCLYNEAAIEGDDANEQGFTFDATEGDWAMSVPCTDEDFDWVRAELSRLSRRITARLQGETVEEAAQESEALHSAGVNVDAFLRS